MMQTDWEAGPGRPEGAVDAVDVWRVDLTPPESELGELLSADERERAARFVRAEDGARWAQAHGVLRALLARYMDADPRSLRFREGAHGKPALATTRAGAAAGADTAGRLRFNLSHSGDVALVAVGFEREVGVDVELPRRAVDHVAIARRVLTADEADRIEAIEDSGARERAFLRAWVRWEAVLKCSGIGIGGADAAHDGPEPWVCELDVGPPAAAALAVEGGPVSVRCWRWPPRG